MQPSPVPPAPSTLLSRVETGHADRPVELHRIEGRTIVRKYYAKGGADVFATSASLWASGFGAARRPPGLARPLAFDAATGALDSEHLDGGALAGRGSLGTVPERLAEVAALCADLHDSGVAVARNRRAAKLLRSLERKLGTGHPLLERLRLAAPRDAEGDEGGETLVVNHGDFSPRNILVTPDGLRLIDLDRVQASGRGRDLAYFGAWCWATQWQRGEAPSWELADELDAHYLRLRPDVAHAGLALGFYRAAALVRIATGWSAFAGDTAAHDALLAEAGRQAATQPNP